MGATLCALGCAFVCGAVGVIFLLVWLALWVAGTYFVSMAVGRMRDESLSPMEPTHQEVDSTICGARSYVVILILILPDV